MPDHVILRAGEIGIAATRAGRAEQPALVLLHGWPQSRALYDGVMEELGKEFLVLAMDLPQVGASRGAPPSAEKTVLADLVLTAAETAGARDITVARLDVGGMIAFAAARDHGERIARAIVMNTVIPGLEPWDELMSDPRIWHFAFHALPDLPETLVRGREKISDALRDEFAEAYARPEALKAGFDWYRTMAKDATHNKRRKKIVTPLLYGIFHRRDTRLGRTERAR
jgi:pimeloyl-ACP methyl ester carboxylesterase